MLERLLADLIVTAHLAFVAFALLGGLAVARWPRLAALHLPAALWAAAVELAGWTCPLTPLENALRARGGGAGYRGGFIEHYLVPVLYPDTLTRETQIALGIGVALVNGLVYAWAVRRLRHARSRAPTGSARS